MFIGDATTAELLLVRAVRRNRGQTSVTVFVAVRSIIGQAHRPRRHIPRRTLRHRLSGGCGLDAVITWCVVTWYAFLSSWLQAEINFSRCSRRQARPIEQLSRSFCPPTRTIEKSHGHSDGRGRVHRLLWRHSNLWSQYDLYVVGQHGILRWRFVALFH